VASWPIADHATGADPCDSHGGMCAELGRVPCAPVAGRVDVLPGMNAGASTHAVPSPIEGSGTAWVLLGSWALSPARPTPIHPRRERRGLPALLVTSTQCPTLQHCQRAVPRCPPFL
jgi:hypothetical protein